MKFSLPICLLAMPLLVAAGVGRVSLAASIVDQTPSRITSTTADDRFKRLDFEGVRVVNKQQWSCVSDRHTGLVWEVKTGDGGLRDSRHSYSWFDPQANGQPGVEDGGRCRGGVKCDTHHYQRGLNAARMCGYADWRLPTREELETLVKFQDDNARATIDRNLFPVTEASWYWTASVNNNNPRYAWYVLFRNGIPLSDLKARPKHVRLVRGGKLPVASHQYSE